MAEPRQSNLTNPDLWIRLIYMILFWLFSWLARAAVGIIGIVQFVMVLLNSEASVRLRGWGDSIARWTEQVYRFLTFASEEKPYPFQDWPVAEEETVPPVFAPEPEPESGEESTPPALGVAPEPTPQEPRNDGFDDVREP
ncbi:MAG: DUF4389 domain-containing protein [Porticoccaceae bacterium]